MSTPESSVSSFEEMDLIDPVRKALESLGYKTPTPIQALTIPTLLEGRDLLGQAQTGTGKTAAFALPILSRLDPQERDPQALVLAPTRELAIQVADAFGRYASKMKGFLVLPIYGGQDYGIQIRGLARGAQVVVGTPGRVMDHMRRGTLRLDAISTVVLDEADEMMRMGFIDDVEWILEQTPIDRQVILFSATMPRQIRRIAQKYLNDPCELTIESHESHTTAAETIRQRHVEVQGSQKVEALARILEAETHDGVIVFVKTRVGTVEVADQLVARGLNAAALSGDMAQKQREYTVGRLKNRRLDILVATDVAARGLDVERISHVINFDTPTDAESYVHRIGRTGRAGKTGEAILFLTRGERHILRLIGRATKQNIETMPIPSVKLINERRVQQFKEKITETLGSSDLTFFKKILQEYTETMEADPVDVAAALAHLMQGNTPLLLDKEITATKPSKRERERERERSGKNPRSPGKSARPPRGMERFTIQVGHVHGVKPGNIVGAIANEIGLDNSHIGRIDIFDGHSTVDLPEGMPKDVFRRLKKVWVCQQQLKISRYSPDSKPRD